MIFDERRVRPFVDRHPGEYAAERAQRFPDFDGAILEPELPDGPLVAAAALLDDRERLPDLPARLEEAQEHDRIRQVGGVNGGRHLADEALVRADEDGGHVA